MNVGAVDFVTKPDVQSPKSVENFIADLISKIKIAANANVSKTSSLQGTDVVVGDKVYDGIKLIAIGASTGGTEAIAKVIRHLPQTTPGIVIVQHIPPIFSRMFAERLNNTTCLSVKEAENGDYIEPGKVLIAPGDRHMRIKKIGDKFKVEVFFDSKVNGHCPSVDVLFESVAKEVGDKAIGIILTGMGYDGAKGLLAMKRKGARTIGQDEKTSVVYGMPKVAKDIGAVEKQISLDMIPHMIYNILSKKDR
jgi:two-component system chemotaxis response regulator CheB